MATAALNGMTMDDSRDGAVSTADASKSCNGSAHTTHHSQPQQSNPAPVAQSRHRSSSSRSEYIIAPGEDDSKRPLLPKSSSSRSRPTTSDQKREPVILKSMTELQQHLELMHDRCIARNLRAAGLGGFEVEDEVIYGVLDANAHMVTGETMLVATILHLKEPDRLHHYVSILLNDGANVNEQDSEGKTALMHAILNGRYKAVKALLRHDKTDLLVRDKDGNTALMHAAAIGSEAMLFAFFKALRKREKHQFQKQQTKAAEDQKENAKSKPADQNATQAASDEKQGAARDGQELWSLLRSDDPLDIQNSRGETAHVLALKNGHVECANLISDEKLKRAKELNKRLNALNHQRGSGSPSILRFAKKSAKKYLQHYGSFDSLYFDREDESDDELMIAGSQMRRSHTADPTAGIQAGCKKSHPITPTSYHPGVPKQRHHQHKGFLIRLNKRFQSNPDLFRVKTGGNGGHDENSTGHAVAVDDGQGAFPISEQQVGGATPSQTDAGRHSEQHQGMPKSISGGLKPQHQQAVMPPQQHQPLIKGSSGPPHSRRQSGPAGSQKRNLAEKLMSFLRIRPKYFVPTSASDMTISASTSASSRQQKKQLNKKYSQQYPNFSSIDQGPDDGEDSASALRKGFSHPDISPAEDKDHDRVPRRGSATTSKVGTPASIRESTDLNQRRSVDLSAIPSLHSQYLADSRAQKYIDDWPYGNTVLEEAPADASMVSITALPTSPPPATVSGNPVLNKEVHPDLGAFAFPPLPP